MIIRHGFPAADLRQVSLGCGHRPAESELHLALEPSRHQRARGGVQIHPQRFQICRDATSGNAPVKSGDRANLRIGKWRGNYP